jgi:hypothetical protein
MASAPTCLVLLCLMCCAAVSALDSYPTHLSTCRSKHLTHGWEYHGPLARGDGSTGTAWECPLLAELRPTAACRCACVCVCVCVCACVRACVEGGREREGVPRRSHHEPARGMHARTSTPSTLGGPCPAAPALTMRALPPGP